MLDKELDKKMLALRLGEANRAFSIRPTAGLQYQVASSSQIPAYGYSSKVPEMQYKTDYGTKTEGMYASLEEVSGSGMSVRY